MVSLSFKHIIARLKETELPEIDVVVGIGTGGIPPAAFVAYHLNADLIVISINYRDEINNPKFNEPEILYLPDLNLTGKRVLLVDDVSVSGKTMEKAKTQLNGINVKTLAMKGKADYVLFPEIKECVKWPWKE